MRLLPPAITLAFTRVSLGLQSIGGPNGVEVRVGVRVRVRVGVEVRGGDGVALAVGNGQRLPN